MLVLLDMEGGGSKKYNFQKFEKDNTNAYF